MRKLFVKISGALFALALLASCSPSPEEASKYYDKISEPLNKVFEKESAVFDTLYLNKPAEQDKLFADFLAQIESSEAAIKGVEEFDGKAEMRDAALKILASYKEASKSDYKELLEIWKIPDSLYTAEDDDKKMEIGKKIDDVLNKEVSEMAYLQQNFLKKYKIENKEEKK